MGECFARDRKSGALLEVNKFEIKNPATVHYCGFFRPIQGLHLPILICLLFFSLLRVGCDSRWI